MPGARRTRGPVCTSATRETHTSIQVKRRQSGIPCAMALRLISCSPRGALLCCPRHLRDAKHHRKLDASVGAPGPHDFAVRDKPFAGSFDGLRYPSAEALAKADRHRSSDDTAASTASHPARSDDRDPPLLPR